MARVVGGQNHKLLEDVRGLLTPLFSCLHC